MGGVITKGMEAKFLGSVTRIEREIMVSSYVRVGSRKM